jgi:hypothetical protein
VRPLTELGNQIGEFDLLLVGGGHVIRFDKTVAYGYLPPAPELHHPTAYGLMPTLLAGWTGVPVAWNAVGVSSDTPTWATWLLAEGSRAASYLAVRDQPSADEIRSVAGDVDVRVVPDTAFGVAALVDTSSREVVDLREELGVSRQPYVVYQPSPDLVPFRSWLRRILRWYASNGVAIVELPISPCLGDRVGVVDGEAQTASPTQWPSPLALAGLVAGAEAVVARSLHLSIAALASGVPVIRRSSAPGSKYRVLDDLRGVHTVTDDDVEEALPLGRNEPAPDIAEHAASLDVHWETIAALLEERPRPRAGALATTIGRLTELVEAAGQEATHRAVLEGNLEAVSAELELERSRGSYVDRIISERDERLLELERRLRETKRQLEQMISSKSWTLTRPLRWARALVDHRASRSDQRSPAESDAAERAPDSELGSAVVVRPDLIRASMQPRASDHHERAVHVTEASGNGSDRPVSLLERTASLPTTPVRKVAFYLPQFHPIPENDAWWGRGFTEWTNVTRARPLFEGHGQPRRPGELGYYDLRVIETQRRQVELARLYGIDAFCFYFYWFGGKRLLERPLQQYLDDQTLDLPFCLCWANESWSRRWDGRADDVLIEQQHSDADDLAFIDYVTAYLDDPRYVRVDGRPLLVVYRPGVLPDARSTVARWRDRYRGTRGDELFIAHATAFDDDPPETYGCDASIEFPPVRLGSSNPPVPPRLSEDEILPLTEDRPHVFDGRFFVQESEHYTTPSHLLFRGVCPGWDNTPRAGKDAYVLWHTTPVGFQTWLRNALVDTEARLSGDERLVFVNAWNEWAEGCHLEPDERNGYAYLEAVRVASVRAAVRPHPGTSAGPLRVGAFVHATDARIFAEYLERLESLEEEPALVVTTTADDRRTIEAELQRCALPWRLLDVDQPGELFPLLDVLDTSDGGGYDVVLKLHALSVAEPSRTTDVVDELLDSTVARDVLRAFSLQPELGLVGSATDRVVLGDLGRPGGLVEAIAHRLGVADVAASRDTYFPSGLYFVRPAALAPLRAIQLNREPDAHSAVAASVGFSILAAGFRIEDTRSFRRTRGAVSTSSA